MHAVVCWLAGQQVAVRCVQLAVSRRLRARLACRPAPPWPAPRLLLRRANDSDANRLRAICEDLRHAQRMYAVPLGRAEMLLLPHRDGKHLQVRPRPVEHAAALPAGCPEVMQHLVSALLVRQQRPQRAGLACDSQPAGGSSAARTVGSSTDCVLPPSTECAHVPARCSGPQPTLTFAPPLRAGRALEPAISRPPGRPHSVRPLDPAAGGPMTTPCLCCAGTRAAPRHLHDATSFCETSLTQRMPTSSQRLPCEVSPHPLSTCLCPNCQPT